MSLRDDYNAAKALYHETGSAAKGTPKGSAQRKVYATARKAFRELGERLKQEKKVAA